MSVSIAKLSEHWVVQDTDSDTTIENDVVSGPCTLVHIQASQIAAVTYLKFYDALTATSGTTAPDYVFRIPSGTGVTDFVFPGDGIKFSNGLTFGASTVGGTGSGGADPASSVKVTLFVKPEV